MGNVVVSYVYDAWGKVYSVTGSLADTLGQINPIRYRSYYYDNETGFYYLNSRYYDPDVKRFINADGLIDNREIGYQNMFSYCGNNPVNMKDTSGQIFGWIALAVVAVVTAVTIVYHVAMTTIEKSDANDFEKEIAKKDPIGAYNANKARNVANEYTQKRYPNTYTHDNTQSNAFKHAMWNAVMTDKMGEKKAQKFADAHEQPYIQTNPEQCAMDFHNNALGRRIALEYKGQGYDIFADKIQEAILNGEAKIITWDNGD